MFPDAPPSAVTAAPSAAERAYNVRAAIPDHAAVFARWRARSATWRAQAIGARLDQPYAPHPLARFDLFPPVAPDTGASPCLVFFHGGYWQAMDKSDSSFLAEPLTRQGVAVGIVGYPKCPDVRLADIVGHARAAVQTIAERTDRLGIDPHRLHVAGHSAGGHLALSLLTQPAPAPRLASVTAISGLFDLRPLVETSLNRALGLDHTDAARLSPALQTPQRVDPPILLAWGTAETDGFARQVETLAQAWADTGVSLQRLPLPGCDHFRAVEAMADARSPLFQAILALIRV